MQRFSRTVLLSLISCVFLFSSVSCQPVPSTFSLDFSNFDFSNLDFSKLVFDTNGNLVSQPAQTPVASTPVTSTVPPVVTPVVAPVVTPATPVVTPTPDVVAPIVAQPVVTSPAVATPVVATPATPATIVLPEATIAFPTATLPQFNLNTFNIPGADTVNALNQQLFQTQLEFLRQQFEQNRARGLTGAELAKAQAEAVTKAQEALRNAQEAEANKVRVAAEQAARKDIEKTAAQQKVVDTNMQLAAQEQAALLAKQAVTDKLRSLQQQVFQQRLRDYSDQLRKQSDDSQTLINNDIAVQIAQSKASQNVAQSAAQMAQAALSAQQQQLGIQQAAFEQNRIADRTAAQQRAFQADAQNRAQLERENRLQSRSFGGFAAQLLMPVQIQASLAGNAPMPTQRDLNNVYQVPRNQFSQAQIFSSLDSEEENQFDLASASVSDASESANQAMAGYVDANGQAIPVNELTSYENAFGDPVGPAQIASAIETEEDQEEQEFDQENFYRKNEEFDGLAEIASAASDDSFDGEFLEGESFNGESLEGESFDGEALEGESYDGESFEGSSYDGEFYSTEDSQAEVDLDYEQYLNTEADYGNEGIEI